MQMRIRYTYFKEPAPEIVVRNVVEYVTEFQISTVFMKR